MVVCSWTSSGSSGSGSSSGVGSADLNLKMLLTYDESELTTVKLTSFHSINLNSGVPPIALISSA